MNDNQEYQALVDNLLSSVAEFKPVEATVSKSFLEGMLGKKLNYGYVISENEKLSKDYSHIVKAYGFNSFYDLYCYADSCDSLNDYLIKGGQKDLSKLKPVKRQVMRNGKMMTTTIYEDSSGEDDDNKNPLDKDTQTEENVEPRNARDLSKTIIGDDHNGIDPKQIAKLKTEAGSLNGTFSTDCSSYLVLQGETGELGGVAGYRKEGSYLYLAFYQSDDLTSGVAYVAFTQLLLRARKLGLGAKIDATDDPLALELFKEYGLKKSGSCYIISKSSLLEALGEP